MCPCFNKALRYLATGDSFASLMYLFKVSKELIARIIPETCKALISVLKENIKVRKLKIIKSHLILVTFIVITYHAKIIFRCHSCVKDLSNHYREPENLKSILDSENSINLNTVKALES